MFKKFLQEIIDAKTDKELDNIFYRQDGIDLSYQRGKITYKELELLAGVIDRIKRGVEI